MLRKLIFIVLSIVLIQISHHACSQKVIKKISKEICECMGEIDKQRDTVTLNKLSQNCLIASLVQNKEQIKKEIKFEGKEEYKELIAMLNLELLKSCDDYKTLMNIYFRSTVKPKDSVTSTVCQSFHKGKFRHAAGFGDTTRYFIFEEKGVKEFNAEGELITTTKTIWVSPCEYNSTFVESKDPAMNKFYSKGDKCNIKIIGIEGNAVIFETYFRGAIMRQKLIKVE